MADQQGSSSELLVELHRLLATESGLQDSLDRVARLARSAIVAAESVGLTLAHQRSGRTVAFAGENAVDLDEAQYDDDTGPCLDSFRDGVTIEVDRISDRRSQWPSFVRAAAEHDVNSSLSIPLDVDGRRVGALNLYGSKVAAFDPTALELARMFAVQAAIAMVNAEIYWEARTLGENLQLALENRDVIGQAKGVLMRSHGYTADQAFDELRRVSQEQNIKLRELAETVTWLGELPSDSRRDRALG